MFFPWPASQSRHGSSSVVLHEPTVLCIMCYILFYLAVPDLLVTVLRGPGIKEETPDRKNPSNDRPPEDFDISGQVTQGVGEDEDAHPESDKYTNHQELQEGQSNSHLNWPILIHNQPEQAKLQAWDSA